MAFVTNTSINIGVHASFRIGVFPRFMPKSGMLDLMVALFLVVKRISILLSVMTEPIYIPTNSIGSLFATPSLAFLNSRLFNDGHLTAVS